MLATLIGGIARFGAHTSAVTHGAMSLALAASLPSLWVVAMLSDARTTVVILRPGRNNSAASATRPCGSSALLRLRRSSFALTSHAGSWRSPYPSQRR